jgi:uncharacterized membrane protein YgcG
MSSASVSITRTYAHHGGRIILRLGKVVWMLLWTVSASAQTPGTSAGQVCTQDPTYCSDTGATPSATTGSGTTSSASGGGSSSGGAGAPPSIPNAPCGDGSPIDAWGDCN